MINKTLFLSASKTHEMELYRSKEVLNATLCTSGDLISNTEMEMVSRGLRSVNTLLSFPATLQLFMAEAIGYRAL